MQRNFNLCAFTLCLLISAFCFLSCTSGSQFDERNKDFFADAAQRKEASFTTTPLDFDGNIQALATSINSGGYAEGACTAGAACTITGIVTLPSSYGVAITSGSDAGGCNVDNKIYTRSFILQDKDAAILVAYGIEPPSQNTADATSAKYILNARNDGMAALGNKIKLTTTKVQKYGDATNSQPIVTDFDITSVEILSTANGIPYKAQSSASAFVRADLYQVRQLEGYVKQSPTYSECPSSGGTRQFQYNFQKGYMGKICVGASSAADVKSGCSSGGKKEYNFQFSHYLGAGTLSGFDTGDMFSYNIAEGSKVRMTGAVFVPQFKAGDSSLSLMLGERLQVETLR